MSGYRKSIDRHHRRPRSIGGDDEERNLSTVPRIKHEAWHMLFSNASAEQIAEIINSFWLDPDYFMVAVRRIK